MRILWFPRFQFDVEQFRITTRYKMCKAIEQLGHSVKIAIAGDENDKAYPFSMNYIRIFIIKKKYLRIATYLIFGYIKFLYSYFVFKPNIVMLDIYSIWFSIPFVFIPKRKCLFIVDNRTPFYDSTPSKSTLEDKIMRFYTKIAFQYCKNYLDGITVITDHFKQQICNNFKVDSFFVGVWGSGIDPELFSMQKYKNVDKPFFLKGKFVLLQHGDLNYSRGLLETIEAISMINKKDIMLILIGEGEAKSKILSKIKEHKLKDKIYVLPPVSHFDISSYISYCDCAIMAYPNIEYWNNNNPIKLLEYLAMGKVVICTDMWTFKNVMGVNKCAVYIKDNNPETIADGINYCYENRNLLNEWGKMGVKIVEDKFTWQKQAINLIKFIEELFGRKFHAFFL